MIDDNWSINGRTGLLGLRYVSSKRVSTELMSKQ